MNGMVQASSFLSILTSDLSAARRVSKTPGLGPDNLFFRVLVGSFKNWTHSKAGAHQGFFPAEHRKPKQFECPKYN